MDGWLCEVKDAQIRDGLHVLGVAPEGQARVGLVLAMLQARQLWSGTGAALPGLREALGLSEDGHGGQGGRSQLDRVEAVARRLIEEMENERWAEDAVPAVVDAVLADPELAAAREPVARGAHVRGPGADPPAGRHHRRARTPCCTPWTAATCPPGQAGRRCAG